MCPLELFNAVSFLLHLLTGCPGRVDQIIVSDRSTPLTSTINNTVKQVYVYVQANL